MRDWVFRPWRQWLRFSGRTTRREYWLFLVQLGLAFVVLLMMIGIFASEEPSGAEAILITAVTVLLSTYAFIASLSASVRRLHDHDKTGWLYLLSFIPLVGWIFYLIMMLTPGTRGENSYGYDPRDGNQASLDDLGAVFS